MSGKTHPTEFASRLARDYGGRDTLVGMPDEQDSGVESVAVPRAAPSPFVMSARPRPTAQAESLLARPDVRRIHYLGRRAVGLEALAEDWLGVVRSIGLDASLPDGPIGLRYLTESDIRRTVLDAGGSAEQILPKARCDESFDGINAIRATRHAITDVYHSPFMPLRGQDPHNFLTNHTLVQNFGLRIITRKGALDDQVICNEFDFFEPYRPRQSTVRESIGRRFLYVALVKAVGPFGAPEGPELSTQAVSALAPSLPRFVTLAQVELVKPDDAIAAPRLRGEG